MTEPRILAARNAAIDRVFAEVLDMTAAERVSYLDALRATDPELTSAVERLLAAAARPDPRLDPEQWIGRRLRSRLGWPPGAADRTGERVGAYRIMEEIGRGGMSVVYLAERADGLFEQQVALKFLGVAHELGVRRFERERQILAALNHPGIARLLDGGADDRGRPFIVMEYVRGRPLDVFCRETGADLKRRLQLVGEVAAAVEYAHRNLVVHRDIKPSNILVTDDGAAKLLDFGIAKLLAPDDGEESTPTRTMVRLLTPEYASPEQVRGDRITTASDVYQLGVVLYELLSGHRPHALGRATPSEIERVICQNDPVPPSTAACRPGGALHERIDAAALRRRLRGDLDTIVLKALAKEPEQRYASVGELRDDLLRYQAGAPVRARPHTARYRAAKFIRRHRAGVSAVAVLVTMLGAYAATVTVQSRRIAAEAARTQQVKEILASLFTAANPGVSQGTEPTASELLAAGASRVSAELGHQPDIQAEMLTLLGEVYGTMGRYDDAAALLEPALTTRRRLLRPADPELARTASMLAQVRHYQGDLNAAETLMREVLRIRRNAFGERSWQTALTLDDLGDLLHTRGELVEAESVLRRALAIQLAVGGDAATAQRHLANVLRDRGSHDDAERLYRASLAASEARFGTLDPIAALTRSELAVLLTETARHEEADSLLQHNLRVYARLYPEGHPMQGTTLRNIGVLRLRQGQPAYARDLLEQAIAAYDRTLPATSSLIPRAQRHLAEARLSGGDAEGAALLAAAVVDRLRALGLDGHPTVADALHIGGMARLEQGHHRDAAALLDASLALRSRLSVEHDPRIQATRRALRAARVAADAH